MKKTMAVEETKSLKDCRNASNPYHECSEYCLKIAASPMSKMNETDSAMVISTSLVQKAIKERKEELMARARASLGITPPPANLDLMLDSSTGAKSTTSHECGEPSASFSIDKPKRCNSNDCLSGEASKRAREDKPNDPTELENALQQLEAQRKAVDDQRSESGEARREFSGDRVVPNWNISSQSSVLKTCAGEDSFELYRACLLPLDQVMLASVAPYKLEGIAAHDLMRVAAVTHQLTLQCTTWQRERTELLEKVRLLEREKREVESRVIKLECFIREITDWTEKAEKALLKAKTEIKRLEQNCSESFNAGRAAGGREFAESEEYRAALVEARLSGAKDFKKSPTFEQILATKAAEHEVIGFMKCQSQVSKLGGFKPGFDPGLLDLAKDRNLESPTFDDDDDDPETNDPEFCTLAEETGVEHPTSLK